MGKVPVSKRYYEPIPGETYKAWLAFCVYRDMGNGRSLDKAWRQAMGKENGRHARHWATWSSQNHWVSRCQAYDNAVMKRARRRVEDERAEKYANLFGRYSW
jgi:hypothetical protein